MSERGRLLKRTLTAMFQNNPGLLSELKLSRTSSRGDMVSALLHRISSGTINIEPMSKSIE